MFPVKEQDKTSETDLEEMNISELPDKRAQTVVMKMLTEVRRTMYGQSDNFNRDRKYKKGQTKAQKYNN